MAGGAVTVSQPAISESRAFLVASSGLEVPARLRNGSSVTQLRGPDLKIAGKAQSAQSSGPDSSAHAGKAMAGGRGGGKGGGRSPMMLVSEPMMTPNMKPPISMEKME
eukprot:COSAG01_NODE_1441_length_10293_cov_4.232392_9_plen_108_part_00